MKNLSLWLNNEDFERDILKVWSGAKHKFRYVGSDTVVMRLGLEISDNFVTLRSKYETLEEYAHAVAKLVHEEDSEPFEIYVVGFERQNGEIVAYYLTNKREVVAVAVSSVEDLLRNFAAKGVLKVEKIPLPSYMIATTTAEPSSMFAKSVPIPTSELVKRDADGKRITAPESLWNEAIENVICNGECAFSELSEKYPAYKKPFRAGLLGFLVDERIAKNTIVASVLCGDTRPKEYVTKSV